MDGCVLLTSTPSCVVSPRGETTHSGVDVNNTHPSMINPLNHHHKTQQSTDIMHNTCYVSVGFVLLWLYYNSVCILMVWFSSLWNMANYKIIEKSNLIWYS